MATAATSVLNAKMSKSPGKLGIMIFGAVILVGVVYAGMSLGRTFRVSTLAR